MWAEIARLAAEDDTTVLLTTHYLDEADQLAGRLAIVDHGRVVVEGTPEQLKRELHGDTVLLDLADPGRTETAKSLLTGLAGLRDVSGSGSGLRARADLGARSVPVVLAALDAAGIEVGSITVARPTLDDVYRRHVGRSFESAEEVAA